MDSESADLAERGRSVSERLGLNHRLPAALASGDLVLAYQPIVRAADRKVTGVEALARLTTPDLLDLAPDVFLPQLFRLGHAAEVTERLLRTALDDLTCLEQQFSDPTLSLSINLSAPQLRLGTTLVTQIEQALSQTTVKPDRVTFEIVEDLAVPHRSLVTTTLTAIRSLGVSLALDDFGTGRSSVEHLVDLDVDELKIDGRFVMAAATNRKARVATEALAAMGEALGLRVVAEGVESVELIPWLHGLGCEFVQGWATGRPSLPTASIGPPVAVPKTPALASRAVTESDADSYLTEIENRLMLGADPGAPEAEASLARLVGVDPHGPLQARLFRVQSWLLHIADAATGALGDHEVAAIHTLQSGDIGRAAAEFSRAAFGASQSNEVVAAQHNITQACALLNDQRCDHEQRFRAAANLAYVVADVGQRATGAELLAQLFDASDANVPDHLRLMIGFNAAVAALELFECHNSDISQLVIAHPDRLLRQLDQLSQGLGPDAVAVKRMPLMSLVVRWRLVMGRPLRQTQAMFRSSQANRSGEPTSRAWSHAAESELHAALGNVNAAIGHSREAVNCFEVGGLYKSRILHCWDRQTAILAGAGRHQEASETQAKLLESFRRDDADKNSQMLGAMLDFDLETVLIDQIKKLAEPQPPAHDEVVV